MSTDKVSRLSLLLSSPSGAVHTGQAIAPKQTQVKYIEEPAEPRFGGGGVVAHAVIDEPRIGHEQGERSVRLYKTRVRLFPNFTRQHFDYP